MPVPPTPSDPVPPSPDPTDTPTPPPTASPTPSPSEAVWQEVETEMLALELRSVDLPVMEDPSGDGTNQAGNEPRDISSDLDLRRAFGGWASLDPQHFQPGGRFDCADPLVFCGQQSPTLGGNDLVLVGMQGDDLIEVGLDRAGQLAVAFDRQGADGAPLSLGGFGGADLVVVADLEQGQLFELIFQGNGFVLRDTPARMRLVGDSALFVMPLGRAELPRYRAVSFERIPPGQVGAGRLDALPAFGGVDSFFDIFAEIAPLN